MVVATACQVLRESTDSLKPLNTNYGRSQGAEHVAQAPPFTIKIEDVKIPETCPLLGVKLGYKDGDKTCSPSLDRIRSDGGYTPENVWVISWRANLIKTNLTLEQFEKFVAALRIAYKES